MAQHVKILGILHIVLGALGVCGGIVVLLVFGEISAMVNFSGPCQRCTRRSYYGPDRRRDISPDHDYFRAGPGYRNRIDAIQAMGARGGHCPLGSGSVGLPVSYDFGNLWPVGVVEPRDGEVVRDSRDARSLAQL